MWLLLNNFKFNQEFSRKISSQFITNFFKIYLIISPKKIIKI